MTDTRVDTTLTLAVAVTPEFVDELDRLDDDLDPVRTADGLPARVALQVHHAHVLKHDKSNVFRVGDERFYKWGGGGGSTQLGSFVVCTHSL